MPSSAGVASLCDLHAFPTRRSSDLALRFVRWQSQHGILYGIMSVTFNDLVELMDRLRSPGGCPWDREQTYATLAPMLLEEAYEAFEDRKSTRLNSSH